MAKPLDIFAAIKENREGAERPNAKLQYTKIPMIPDLQVAVVQVRSPPQRPDQILIPSGPKYAQDPQVGGEAGRRAGASRSCQI